MKNNILLNKVYTYGEVADLLSVSKRTLASFVKTNHLRPIVFGNKYRFLGSEILRFLEDKH